MKTKQKLIKEYNALKHVSERKFGGNVDPVFGGMHV
jgi:hypothetical protein